MGLRLRTVGLVMLLVLGWLASAAAPPASAVGSSVPLPIPSISAGGYMTCGLQTDGTAACWGENGVPANDVANTSPGGGATPPAGIPFLEVNAGYATSCGVTFSRVLRCWGSGRFDKFAVPTGTFTHVVPGLNYVCAIRTDGTLACWGGEDPALDPGQLVVANMPSGVFTQVSMGNRFACALRADGSIACWGVSSAADAILSVPPGTYSYVNVSNFTACALRTDGTPVCWGRNAFGQRTVPAGTFTQLSTGFGHVCGLRPDATVTCWGRSAEGQTTVPAGTYTHVSAGTFHTCAMPTSGPPARCWGNNAAGRMQPSMSPIPPHQGYVASPYSFQLTMKTYISPVPDFSVTAGTPPPGLTLSPAGQLSGTPTTAGSYTFTVAGSSKGLSPPDCVNPGGGDLSCTPGDTNSIATATRTFTLVIGAVAPPPGSIAGTVTASAGGAPIAGAPIAITHSGGAPAGSTTTDGSGNYRVDNLLPGNYKVTASGTELQPQTKPAAVASTLTTTVDFVLAPLIRPTVTGVWNNHYQTVTDGVFVEWSEAFEQRLDMASAYTVHRAVDCSDAAVATAFRGNWLPSAPRIRDLEMNGWANVVPGGTYYLRVAAGTEYGMVTGQRNALACVRFVAELRATDRSAVAGQVTNSVNLGLAGATVTVTRTLRDPGTVAGQATTDAAGNYRVDNLPPGPYSVGVAAAGHYSQTRGVTTTGGATTTANFALLAAPVARNDAYTQYGSDTPLIVPARGVLTNDTDTENDPLTAALVSGPSQGTLALNPDGSFTYQPVEDFVGVVSFTYKANDGTGDSNVATATITVGAGCRGMAATMTGTNGANLLNGTPGPDVIAGLGGNDMIDGAGGNDVICGGSGRDTIYSEAGDDYADGGTGNDNVQGGAGNDSLFGGIGNDKVIGDGGADVADGGAGDDHMEGNGGNDTLVGGPGNDYMEGGAGNDTMSGGDGADKVLGLAGDDSVDGGAGDDYVEGSGGNDTVSGGDGVDWVTGDGGSDVLSGGPGSPDRCDGGAGIDSLAVGHGCEVITGVP